MPRRLAGVKVCVCVCLCVCVNGVDCVSCVDFSTILALDGFGTVLPASFPTLDNPRAVTVSATRNIHTGPELVFRFWNGFGGEIYILALFVDARSIHTEALRPRWLRCGCCPAEGCPIAVRFW